MILFNTEKKSGGAIPPTLLWENPSPDEDFTSVAGAMGRVIFTFSGEEYSKIRIQIKREKTDIVETNPELTIKEESACIEVLISDIRGSASGNRPQFLVGRFNIAQTNWKTAGRNFTVPTEDPLNALRFTTGRGIVVQNVNGAISTAVNNGCAIPIAVWGVV